MRSFYLLPIATLACGMLVAASSQAAETQAPGAQPPASPETAAPKDQSPNAPLSKKLDKNDGVLKPPKGVDPEMHIEPPANPGSKMPIIVPPGEPGGDQSVQPK